MKIGRLAILMLLCFDVVEAFPDFTYTEIRIPMRDGQSLAADLYTTDPSVPKPVILIQTPYNKELQRTSFQDPDMAAPLPLEPAALNYVVVDWRGFHDSEDAAVPGAYDRGKDGFDAVEWIADQAWCNGRVGTYGPSALGLIQFQTARLHPPHLVCAMPTVKDYKTKYTDFYYGGVYRKEQVESMEKLHFLRADSILAHPTHDTLWEILETVNDYPESFAVPMLLATGWFDHYPGDVLRAFEDIRTRSDVSVRSSHRLVVGPWLHTGMGKSEQGGLEFPESVGLLDSMARWFFHRYLLEEDNGYENQPVVQYFVMGQNAWHEADSWPSVAAAFDTLYMESGGLLSEVPPVSSTGSDGFLYDPRDPSPTFGGSRFNPFNPFLLTGPRDQRFTVESRNDALIYSTPVLTEPLLVLGSIDLHLFVSTDCLDTDWAVRLCDVYPDGRSILLTQGICRMRFRDSFETGTLADPGIVDEATVGLEDMAMEFQPGHRMRIIVTSSDYPHFDINLNNGGPLYQAGDTLIAANRVWHDVSHPSVIVWKTNGTTGVEPCETDSPSGFDLLQNYPNPFNASTSIRFMLSCRSFVTLSIHDVRGREVSVPVCGMVEAGTHRVNIDAPAWPSGMYVIRLEAGKEVRSEKMVLVR